MLRPPRGWVGHRPFWDEYYGALLRLGYTAGSAASIATYLLRHEDMRELWDRGLELEDLAPLCHGLPVLALWGHPGDVIQGPAGRA